jgi:hypothetical protein
MNDTTFVSGNMTDQNPVVLALISDESGINTVGSGIGHDITCVLDGDTKDLLILNDYYQSDLGTFASGFISYPFFNLADGMHTITLKVWDVYNNSAEATLSFLMLKNLFNYPNPFRIQTTFSFQYNDANESLDVSIDIYSITGMHIKTIRQTVSSSGYLMNQLTWDGRDDHGMVVGSGVYVYYVKVNTPAGSSSYSSSKLIYLR